MFATQLSHLWCITDFFRYAWRYWLDFWFECIVISYRSSLHFVLVQWFFAELCPWTLKFGQIFSCHHFISLWFEILTWFLLWLYNHKLQINFEIHSGWMIFGQLTAVGCHHFFFTMIWDIDLIFWYVNLRKLEDTIVCYS